MNRRTFNKLAGLSTLGTLAGSPKSSAAQVASTEQVLLEDDHLLVAFDRRSGALTKLQRKKSDWLIHQRPDLGVSFRLLVPIPGRRQNYVLGEKQQAAKVERITSDRVQIEWTNLQSEHGGVLAITVAATVTLSRGQLIFDTSLTNNSPHTIETIDYPYIGDLHPPTQETPMQSEHMWYGNLVGDELYPRFGNEKGYWGVDYPTKTIESKQSLFALVQTPTEGFYVGMHDATCPYLLEFTFEQHPGVINSIDSAVPLTSTISGLPVHLEFRTCHFGFILPHSKKNLAPVVIETYDGSWHVGLDIYKNWRATWFKQPHLPKWVQDVHSWQQLQIDGAEEDFTIPYRDIVKYGEDCAQNGITAIQLVGWNRGGQDGGDPAQDTDPGLGTHQELVDAISRIQSLGVKIILFGKLNWADMTTSWYKTELYKFQCTDPYGIRYEQGGYSYYTPTQLAGINNRRRAVMDFCCVEYRNLITKEFQKLLDLNAAGWLFDEVCHHGPVEYSFSADHGYVPPKYIYSGDLPTGAQLRSAGDKLSPDFIFAGEGPQDWQMQYYPVSYFRINAGSRAVCRYIDPQAVLVVAVTGFDDREMLNLILLSRYVISYEPFNFKGHVTDFPLTLAYGKKIDALRKRHREYLWDSTFRDTLGATVTPVGTRYSVFVTESGKRAVVLINNSATRAVAANVSLPNSGSLVVVTPEQPAPQPSSGAVQLPPRSAAVLMEQ
jgi:hypothetical protein